MFFVLLGLTIILGSAPTLGCDEEGIEDIAKYLKGITTSGGYREAVCYKFQCDDNNVYSVCGNFEARIAVCDAIGKLSEITKCELYLTPTATYDDHYAVHKTSLNSSFSDNSWNSTTIPSPRPTPIPTTWLPSTTTTADPHPTTITTHRPTPGPSPILWWSRILSLNNTFHINNSPITIIVN